MRFLTTDKNGSERPKIKKMQRLDILHPSIDDYLLDITPERDAVLTEMEAHARVQTGFLL